MVWGAPLPGLHVPVTAGRAPPGGPESHLPPVDATSTPTPFLVTHPRPGGSTFNTHPDPECWSPPPGFHHCPLSQDNVPHSQREPPKGPAPPRPLCGLFFTLQPEGASQDTSWTLALGPKPPVAPASLTESRAAGHCLPASAASASAPFSRSPSLTDEPAKPLLWGLCTVCPLGLEPPPPRGSLTPLMSLLKRHLRGAPPDHPISHCEAPSPLPALCSSIILNTGSYAIYLFCLLCAPDSRGPGGVGAVSSAPSLLPGTSWCSVEI